MDLHHVDIQFSVRGGRAGLAGGMKKKKESSTQSLMDLAYKDRTTVTADLRRSKLEIERFEKVCESASGPLAAAETVL